MTGVALAGQIVQRQVWVCVAEKVTLPTFAPFTVTVWLTGLKITPLLLGVIVYVPFARPGKP